MENRPFSEHSNKPDNASLQTTLGKAFLFYSELEALTKRFKQEWNYSKMSGWMQKVFDNKKALFYLIPLHDSFKINLTIREKEKVDFLKDKSLSEIHLQLESAKKYSEGFALQFLITNEKSFCPFRNLVKKIIEKRMLIKMK